MRLGPRRKHLKALLALAIPCLLLGWTLTAVSAASPSPASSGGGGSQKLPGDPAKGQQLYGSSGCTACHGANLEGGVGPKLNPIHKLPDAKDPLDPTYLIDTITNGKNGVGGFGQMPAKGGNQGLSEQDIKDIASFIIDTNRKGPSGLGPVELARSNVFWITASIFVLVMLTLLLARYNMRWIDRRAAARRNGGRPG